MIKEYWNLIGWEPFLAITWEPDFSQACSFHRMLMNNKNFHFTQIPDKINDMIFLKSPKIMFLGHFGPFLPNADVFQKIQLCHTQLYMAPNIKLSLRKNIRANPKKTYRQTEGVTDRPYFTGPFQPRPGIQQLLLSKWLVVIHQILF